MLGIISEKLAYELTSNRWDFETFIEQAQLNEYFFWTHTNFYYSYPEWQKKWINTQDHCCYHKIEIACNCCHKQPERNYAGYGTICMYKSFRSTKKRQLFLLLCKSCAPYRNSQIFKPKIKLLPPVQTIYQTPTQLTLF